MAEPDLPELRLSDSERDEVVAQLSLAMAEGRLDTDEFSERSRQVYAATVPSDLTGVLDGLPVSPAPVNALSGTTRSRRFFTLLGDRVHRGDIDLGDETTSIAVIGDTTFDLTQVTAQHVNLRCFSLIGDLTILVRPGTRVATNVLVLIGDRSDHSPAAIQTDETMTVTVRGFALIADVRIKVVET